MSRTAATFQNLKKKYVMEVDQCAFCAQVSEDVAHALFYYSNVRRGWMDFCSQMGIVDTDFSFWDLANLALDRGADELLTKFVIIAWGIWYRRNKFLYEQVSMQISVVVNNALNIQHKQLQVFDVSNKKIHRVVSWNPPPIGFLKLNVDGAMFGDQNFAGVGVLLRDHNGDVVVACSKSEREVSSAEFIEATTLLKGLQLCAQWGVPKVLLETDCLILVHALNDMAEFLTDFDFILQDIRRLMRGFQEAKVVHVNRLGNMLLTSWQDMLEKLMML
ncbi:uncharacterized protein LOC121247334 [Juglans microcarpa x Juglans regia]|uniref:uncharacterized protein LOC121247334 n=1 Tax=Juglans microcarpa x Juglans regia TaxID=2249226 RepID=UPI001B7F2DDD|nr:uncharacterized protein LOC121247334 [Juglans microcarpa x Juglans regia]